jgi:uncharacterized protein (DUF362 family)
LKIFLESISSGYEGAIGRGFAFLGDSGIIRSSDRVTIKPNLTFPCFRKGVVTNPEAIRAVVEYVKQFTDHVVICESDSGGYNRFSMTEVFEKTGVAEIAKRYGVRVVNMSLLPWRAIPFRAGFRRPTVPVSTLLLEDTDVFITMPVPKVHANAVISVALKNQWGVIQPESRLALHPYLKEVLYAINKVLPRSLAVVDGKYGLTRSGPLRGDVLELNWIAFGDDLFAVDYLMTDLMGIAPAKIPYLRWIFQQEGLDSLENVQFNTDPAVFRDNRFYLERQWTDIPGFATFHSRLLAYVGYQSVLAKPLHKLLYKFREPFF